MVSRGKGEVITANSCSLLWLYSLPAICFWLCYLLQVLVTSVLLHFLQEHYAVIWKIIAFKREGYNEEITLLFSHLLRGRKMRVKKQTILASLLKGVRYLVAMGIGIRKESTSASQS